MKKSLAIKVCGMRRPDNIRAVAQLPIDYMGFIFYPKSSRYVEMESSGTGLLPDTANAEISSVGYADKAAAICKVGVL